MKTMGKNLEYMLPQFGQVQNLDAQDGHYSIMRTVPNGRGGVIILKHWHGAAANDLRRAA